MGERYRGTNGPGCGLVLINDVLVFNFVRLVKRIRGLEDHKINGLM